MKSHSHGCTCSGCTARRNGWGRNVAIASKVTRSVNGKVVYKRTEGNFLGNKAPHPSDYFRQVNQQDIDALRRFVIKQHWKWPFVFSCNCHGEIWPFVTYDYTPEEERRYVHGESALLNDIIRFYLTRRPEGGRLFSIITQTSRCSPSQRLACLVRLKTWSKAPKNYPSSSSGGRDS